MYSGLYVDEAEDLEEEDFIDTTVDTIVSIKQGSTAAHKPQIKNHLCAKKSLKYGLFAWEQV